MKTLTITTRRKANAMQLDSLFKASTYGTLTKSRYDMGKYQHSNVGKEVEVDDFYEAIWSERRKDKDGPHYVLFCFDTRPPANGGHFS